MKKPSINELRTYAMLQTNAPKILYGSGVVGAGRKDVYQDYRVLRGKFTQLKGNRTLGNGTIQQAVTWEFIIRYEVAIMAVLDLQTRFCIEGKTYTVDSYDIQVVDKSTWFVFTLLQFGK